MKRRVLSLALAALALTCLPAGAQPKGFGPPGGDDPSSRGWMHDQRLERMIDYLELDETQAQEWQLVLEDHFAVMRVHRDRMEALRSDFRSLADETDPNLEQLGQLALDMHREGQVAGSVWDQLNLDLEAVLTPEQVERYEAAKAARGLAGPRFGHREPRARWQQPDVD